MSSSLFWMSGGGGLEGDGGRRGGWGAERLSHELLPRQLSEGLRALYVSALSFQGLKGHSYDQQEGARFVNVDCR